MTRNQKGSIRPRRRYGYVAVLFVVSAVALAACGGAGTPRVASLGNGGGSSGANGSGNGSGTGSGNGGANGSGTSGANGSGRSPSAQPKGNPTALLNQWATCMHSHGDPSQADPVIASDKTIQVHIPQDAQSLSNAVHAGTAPCNQYLTAAQRALRNGQPFPQPPSLVTEVKFAECIRANGVPNYPNPSGPNGSETNFNGTGIDPNSPQVQNADKYCTKKLDIHWAVNSALGDAGDIQVSSGPGNGPPGGPGGNGGSGANVPRTAGG